MTVAHDAVVEVGPCAQTPSTIARVRRGRLLVAIAIVILAVCGAGATVWALLPGLTLLPPHRPTRSRAVLDRPLREHIQSALDQTKLKNVDEVLRFALSETDARLHFGFKHKTNMGFGMKEREGNCIEYAHLFSAIFDMSVSSKKLDARAYAVHSAHARVFDRRLPWRGFGDHDWVLVVDGVGNRRLYVDPTLHDFGLGWDIEDSVKARERIKVR